MFNRSFGPLLRERPLATNGKMTETPHHLPDELAVLAYLEPVNERWIEELGEFGIRVTLAPTPVCSVPHHLPTVVLIQLKLLSGARATDLLAPFHKQQSAVVILLDQDDGACHELIEAGIAGVASLSGPTVELAGTLRIAHRHRCFRHELSTRILALESKIEQMKLIGQAKAIVAEQLKISESAALRHLRSEARNRRRSLHELASVVLEARKIVGREPGSDRPSG